MKKFRGKYRIPSARLSGWNYASPGSYFITICTKKRKKFFGEIVNGEMQLNDIGRIASKCWADIPDHFENTELNEFVVMPNHVHGIIILNGPAIVETGQALSLRHALSLQQPHPRFRNPGKNTISAMVGSFKSAVTKFSRPINPEFGWQNRFHDHIIRDNDAFYRIARYIRENPSNWETDRFYK